MVRSSNTTPHSPPPQSNFSTADRSFTPRYLRQRVFGKGCDGQGRVDTRVGLHGGAVTHQHVAIAEDTQILVDHTAFGVRADDGTAEQVGSGRNVAERLQYVALGDTPGAPGKPLRRLIAFVDIGRAGFLAVLVCIKQIAAAE